MDWKCEGAKCHEISEAANGSRVVLSGASRFEVEFFLPGVGAEDQFHHACLPRMRGTGLAPLGTDWRDGWHSPLCADFHFDQAVGAQPFGYFPPFAVFQNGRAVLLIGPLTENAIRSSYAWEVREEGLSLTMTLSDVSGAESLGEVSEEIWVQSWNPGEGPSLSPALFEEYNRRLPSKRERAYSGLYWGTWNDGTFRDIDAERIVSMARWLSERAPEVKWVQIDDGWAGPSRSVVGTTADRCSGLGMSHFGVFYQPEDLPYDERFPNGLAAVADEIRAAGLRPMIWLTYHVHESAALYRDHPEWFLPDCRLHFMTDMRFLDPSLPEVQEYTARALDRVFHEWGFEGCKLDFWTMAFEQSDARGRLPGTLVQSFAWFAGEIRKRLPDDGILMHCIDLPFGAPFRAQWFDQFRYYSDSEGICASEDMMREQARWAAFLVGLYGVQKWWTPNGDGLGIFDHFAMPDTHFRRWCALLVASGTLTELAGWLSRKPDHPRVSQILELLKWSRQGSPVTLPGWNYAESSDATAPSIWVRDDGGQWLIGLTNWTQEELHINPSELGLPSDVKFFALDRSEATEETWLVGPEDGWLLLATRQGDALDK